MTPILLYDGDCSFCSSCARFAERRLRPAARIEPWQQADLDALGVTEAEAIEAVQWVPGTTDHTSGPEAIADLMLASGAGWRIVGRVLATKPVLWVAWPVYEWVSRHRHQMPGGTPACARPGD